jgi:hypothetical protein
MAFVPSPAWASRGFPSRQPPSAEALDDGLLILSSPSERSRKRWNRLSLVPPLMGFECRPPTGIPPARPLPGAEAPFGSTLPSADSCSALVVSHHHDGLLRAEVTGLLHPATGQGFAAFHACRLSAAPEGEAGGRGQSPRRGSHPSKSSPHQQPHRITAAVAFLPLPSCPAWVPTEIGVRADRHPPRRGTYTRDSLPPGAGGPAPRGWVSGFPWDGGSGPPRRSGVPARCLARGAPKSSGCRG